MLELAARLGVILQPVEDLVQALRQEWHREQRLKPGREDVPIVASVEEALALPDRPDALLIGINSDESVRQLKGNDRPINNETDRASVIAALQSVDAACIFAEKRATNFLKHAQPDIYVKGGDYTLDTLDQDERRTVESAGGKIVIIPFVPGKSTTATLARISRL